MNRRQTYVSRYQNELHVQTEYGQRESVGKSLHVKHYGRIVWGFMAAVVMVIGISLIMNKTVSSATVRQQSVKCYRSVEIEKGDSIWSIAKKYYTDDWNNLESYIEEIKQFNGIANDNIQAGCYLAIPYYEVR